MPAEQRNSLRKEAVFFAPTVFAAPFVRGETGILNTGVAVSRGIAFLFSERFFIRDTLATGGAFYIGAGFRSCEAVADIIGHPPFFTNKKERKKRRVREKSKLTLLSNPVAFIEREMKKTVLRIFPPEALRKPAA